MPRTNLTSAKRKERYRTLRLYGASREVAMRYRDVSYYNYMVIRVTLIKAKADGIYL